MKTTSSGILESPVKLNLNQPFTVDDVRRLVGSVQDDRSWQLVITYAGTAYLCDRDETRRRQPRRLRDYTVGIEIGDPQLAEDRAKKRDCDRELLNQASDQIYLRFESFCHGNSYVGLEAAQDDAWVNRLYRGILRNWPKPELGSSYIDFF